MNRLRVLEEKIQSVPVLLNAAINLIQCLMKINADLRSEAQGGEISNDHVVAALLQIQIRVQGYQDSASSLYERVKGLRKLVGPITYMLRRSMADHHPRSLTH